MTDNGKARLLKLIQRQRKKGKHAGQSYLRTDVGNTAGTDGGFLPEPSLDF